jgi:serine phosphatase RsbU (regulator of sigma subunit)
MINSHNEIEELETLLSPNSKLICYTDGFTEARGKGTDMYGLNRLGQKSLELGKSRNADELGKSRNADELGRALKQDAQDFLDGGDFTDDFTLVIVEAEG